MQLKKNLKSNDIMKAFCSIKIILFSHQNIFFTIFLNPQKNK